MPDPTDPAPQSSPPAAYAPVSEEGPEHPGGPLRDALKGLIFLAVLGALVLLTRLETVPFSDTPNPLRQLTDREQAKALRETIREGAAGPALFIAAYAVVCVVFLPTIVMSILGGAAFGLWPGILYIWLGANLGALATFGLARVLGRDIVRRLAGRWIDRLDSRTERHGFVVMLYSRLLGLPFTPVNYAAGVASVRLRDFFLGTALGILPFTVAFTYFGESLFEGAGAEAYLRLAATMAVLAVAVAIPLVIRHFVNRRKERLEA